MQDVQADLGLEPFLARFESCLNLSNGNTQGGVAIMTVQHFGEVVYSFAGPFASTPLVASIVGDLGLQMRRVETEQAAPHHRNARRAEMAAGETDSLSSSPSRLEGGAGRVNPGATTSVNFTWV